MKIDKKALEFEWDEGDIEKNKKHRVEDKEAEEVFFDNNKVIFSVRDVNRKEVPLYEKAA